MRIFVSSTFEDLREHRAGAIRVLRQLGHEVLAMEDMVAASDTPLARVLQMVDRAEAYVGIFAWRYGHLPKPDGLNPLPVVAGADPGATSITHYEYLRARQNRLPILAFLLDERTPWPPDMVDGHLRGTDLPVDASAIRTLRAQLQGERIVSRFTTPADLEARVAAAITMTGLSRQIDLAGTQSLGSVSGTGPLDDSASHTILNGIAEVNPAQRALKIDIGQTWWSTRLYLAAALAERLTAVRWLLLVHTPMPPLLPGDERFVGLVPTNAVRSLIGRLHPETQQFEAAAKGLDLPEDVLQAGRLLLTQCWLPAFMQAHSDPQQGEQMLQQPVTEQRLQRWLGGTLLSSAVPIADLARASVVDLLLLVAYPCEQVPVSTVCAPGPGTDRRPFVDVVDKAVLNRRLALSYLQELKERARLA